MYFRRIILLYLLKLSDLCILMFGFLMACWFVQQDKRLINFQQFFNLDIKVTTILFLIVLVFFWHIIFSNFGLYRSRRMEKVIQEWKDILKATTTGTTIFFISGTILDIETFTLIFYLTLWFSTTILTLSFRIFLRYFLGKIRFNNRNLRFVTIAGTNQRAYDIERWIDEHKEMGYRVIGYIDDEIFFPKEQMNILGKISNLSNILKNNIIDEIFLTLPLKSQYEKIQKIIEQAEEQGITVRFLSPPFNTKITTVKRSPLEEFPLLTIGNNSPDNFYFLAKRTIDIVLASVLLILTFPVMLVAVVATKLITPGPIFFNQDRVGYNKRVFRLYKFRTMVANAEELQRNLESLNEMDGPVFKIKNDPRITIVGKWLRKTSADELPQIFNVLKGDMSIVGPRPLPVRDYKGFNKDWQRRRFSVRPGITCLWQISGRNNISFQEWMQLDMQYIDQWSIWLDFKIIVKTIPKVFKGS